MLEHGVFAGTGCERRNDFRHRRALDRERLARLVQPRHDAAMLRHPERALVVDRLAARWIMAVMRTNEDPRSAGGGPGLAQAHRAGDDALRVRLCHQQMPDRMIEMRAVHVDDEQRALRKPRGIKSGFLNTHAMTL